MGEASPSFWSSLAGSKRLLYSSKFQMIVVPLGYTKEVGVSAKAKNFGSFISGIKI